MVEMCYTVSKLRVYGQLEACPCQSKRFWSIPTAIQFLHHLSQLQVSISPPPLSTYLSPSPNQLVNLYKHSRISPSPEPSNKVEFNKTACNLPTRSYRKCQTISLLSFSGIRTLPGSGGVGGARIVYLLVGLLVHAVTTTSTKNSSPRSAKYGNEEAH